MIYVMKTKMRSIPKKIPKIKVLQKYWSKDKPSHMAIFKGNIIKRHHLEKVAENA